jgi:thymidylate synthase (FAD)
MEFVEPEVHLIAKTELDTEALEAYLVSIGDPDWKPDGEIAGGENLVVAAGKMCYRSWQPWDPEKPEASNPNVGRVRNDSKLYLYNILKSQHGSILEHVNVTFVLILKRVFDTLD